MSRTCASLIALCLALAACGSVPPAPADRFYRLQPASVSAPGGALPGPIAVRPLRADSLYAERPLVFSEEGNPRQLRQYHYHLWLYAPAQMVHDHLTASLGGVLDFAAGGRPPHALDGRIVRFERVLDGRHGKAAAALELRLSAGGKTVLAKTYRAEQAAGDASFPAFVIAMEQALGKIYAEFLGDVSALGAKAGTRG